MIKRDFSVKGIDFLVADYKARHNEFERGLKYLLLIKIYDNPYNDNDYSFKSTGYKGSTIKELKELANREIDRWMWLWY